MYKVIITCMLLLLAALEYRYWLGNDSVFRKHRLAKELVAQQAEVMQLQERNELMLRKIRLLKQDPHAIEEQARYELGMVRQGEKYYQVVETID